MSGEVLPILWMRIIEEDFKEEGKKFIDQNRLKM